MRGALTMQSWCIERKRIIPADAGSTHGEEPAMTSQKDHPRGCGEHLAVALAKRNGGGSSPRMRGARQLLG